MRILAHRGASADFPENTLEAFMGAAAQGADGVELDVMRCRSGELVVCHDERLDRLAQKPWEIARTDWQHLRTADVGTPLGFKPARIPLLDEVLEALPRHLLINVELKCETRDDGGLAEVVGAKVVERGLEERVMISSFNPYSLTRLAKAHPQLARGFLIDPDQPWIPQAWWWLPLVAKTSVHPHWSACTPGRVNRWQAQGWQVAVWTVDDVHEARALRAMRVDFIITNRPGALREELKRLV